MKFFLSTDHDISPRISLPFFFGGAFCTTATPRLPLTSPAALWQMAIKIWYSLCSSFVRFFRRCVCLLLLHIVCAPMTQKRRTDRVISGCAGEIHDWREEIKKKVSTLPRGGNSNWCVHIFSPAVLFKHFTKGGKRKFYHFATSHSRACRDDSKFKSLTILHTF